MRRTRFEKLGARRAFIFQTILVKTALFHNETILCYNAHMMNGRLYQITTRSKHQRDLWQHLFNMVVLPVRSPWPTEAVTMDGRLAAFYTLDPTRMTPQQLHRLAAHITARQRGVGGYVRVLERIRSDGYNINAEKCELVEAAQERPSHFIWRPGWVPALIGVGA